MTPVAALVLIAERIAKAAERRNELLEDLDRATERREAYQHERDAQIDARWREMDDGAAARAAARRAWSALAMLVESVGRSGDLAAVDKAVERAQAVLEEAMR